MSIKVGNHAFRSKGSGRSGEGGVSNTAAAERANAITQGISVVDEIRCPWFSMIELIRASS
jgi:hypothetical protein